MSKYVYSESMCIQCTKYWDKTQMLRKFPLDKISGTKNALLFLLRAASHHSFNFNFRFLLCWSTRFVFLNLCVGFSIFDSVSFLLKFIFRSTKSMASLNLKHYNSFQNESNRKATQKFAPRALIFKLQQEVLKFNDTCVSWSSPKTNLETNILNIENRSFENVSFPQW